MHKQGVSIDYYLVLGKGILGYLRNLPRLKIKINEFNPDLIHAHYGLSGLLATMQRGKKVVITFHGCDINRNILRFLSWIAHIRAASSIFVSQKLAKKIKATDSFTIPCGVDINIFKPTDKTTAKKRLGLCAVKKYILFSSSFDMPVKNYSLARKSLERININNIELVELKGYTREEVGLLMNACDIALLTSVREGSPQFVKEAMACNCPIVSTDVGDVREVIGDTKGCHITTFEPEDIAEKITMALDFSEKNGRTQGRERLINLKLDSETVAGRIIKVYEKVLS